MYELDNLVALCLECHLALHHPLDREHQAWKDYLDSLRREIGSRG